MTEIAVSIGNVTLYWNAIVIFLAVAACFTMTAALFTSHGGRGSAVWLLLPLSVLLSVLFSRFLHWYCHEEQYAGLWQAITDYSSGSYCMTGVLLGTASAALIVWALGFTSNVRRLFDCLAPGAALGIALIRLSSLFTTADRSKIVIKNPTLQHLPLASGIPTTSGGTEYRFATFFAQFLIMLLIFWLLLRFFDRRRRWSMKGEQPRDGNVALMFLTWYSAAELVLDSTRYDASFLRLNGFVSMVQIVSAVTLLAVLIVYSRRSIKANGRHGWHWLLWVGFFLTIACTGVMEYLVQRHGNWYLLCYPVMSVSCLASALVVYGMYRTVCIKKPKKKQV